MFTAKECVAKAAEKLALSELEGVDRVKFQEAAKAWLILASKMDDPSSLNSDAPSLNYRLDN